MFQALGYLTTRAWWLLLAVWIAVLVALALTAPPWDAVAESGQFAFLPADAPSIRGRELFRSAFPDEPFGSSIVIVLRLENEELRSQDRKFIDDDLKPGLMQLRDEQGPPPVIARIRAATDQGTGALLTSGDKHAALVAVQLTADFLDRRAWPAVTAVEGLIDRLRSEEKVPAGMDIRLTGSAVAGRDYRQAESKSANLIQTWTVIIVIALLLIIYRSPVLALIPILTVVVAVKISLSILALAAAGGLMVLSETTRIYITVLAYGAGVDYCLFLTARYREELERGVDERDALTNAVAKVGATVTASAATVIGGIAMLAFGRFGKFHQAGITIPMSLAIVLLASLTFSPALLRLLGRWAFWPARPGRFDRSPSRTTWEKIGQILLDRPGKVWLASVGVLLPFAVVAVVNGNGWDYGLFNELPASSPSLAGTQILREQFAPGTTGPITVLVRDDAVEFGSDEGVAQLAAFTKALADRKAALGIADVRSLARPLGITKAALQALADVLRGGYPHGGYAAVEKATRERAAPFYVSRAGNLTGHVTRIDVVTDRDPLSRKAIEDLARLERVMRDHLPAKLRDADIDMIGPTASLRDLRDVTTGDLRRAEVLVPVVVFVILVILLRDLPVSLYLILTVLFSFLATLGVTVALFWALNPSGFQGLDWKVPIFLFTILVAVGEDYNIFLIGRVKEEQRRTNPVQGVAAALVATGGIISSCGVIMAGTFASLLAGSLTEMKQLGFALAFGVLLDTLVVRPVLVPACLIVLRGGRLSVAHGPFAKWRADSFQTSDEQGRDLPKRAVT